MRLPVEAEAQSFGHAEAAAMLAEQLDLSLEDPGSHGDILPSNLGNMKWYCLRVRRRRSSLHLLALP
jgi:hypothetical protein